MKRERILEEFAKKYEDLVSMGLRINGIAELQPNQFAISISVPLVFDNRSMPKEFMGLLVRSSTQMDELPEEFKDLDPEKDYVWAYQRFEKYVENNEAAIRNKLNNPNLTKREMLDALCFGNFEKHKENCITWEKQGKIPEYRA